MPIHKYATLKMPGLKPSDWYLLCQEKEYFDLDMRQLFTLGLRLIYSGWHNARIREIIQHLASEVHNEDMNTQREVIVYKEFKDIRVD